ncbi:hypothetical protein HZC35_00085 [Candidatus Saganbacteria bacterium]|nr:hypothetical protein [Candidatus Saganbacteria bacterium]
MSRKEENLNFFKSKLLELLSNPTYKDKYLVISNKEIKNVFDTFNSALEYAVATFPNEEFIIQQVVDETKVVNFIRAAV